MNYLEKKAEVDARVLEVRALLVDKDLMPEAMADELEDELEYLVGVQSLDYLMDNEESASCGK